MAVTSTTEQFARDSDNLSVRPNGKAVRVVLVRCPACGFDFRRDDGTIHEGRHKTRHLAGHSPEDFGLSPMRGDSDGV